MNYKRIMIVAIFLLAVLTVGTVSASEDGLADNSTAVGDAEDNEVILDDGGESSPGTFTDLANEIANASGELNLTKDYKYVSSDSDYENGVMIDKGILINGNGHTIDGSYSARIFSVSYDVEDAVVFKDIVFVRGSHYNGGALYGGSAVNCTFANCSAEDSGGAMYGGSAVNCTFVGNSADYFGGAMYMGSAVDCSFVNCSSMGYYDSGYSCVNGFGGAMYMGSAVNCSFTGNFARSGGALYGGSAVNCTFIKCRALFYTTPYHSDNGGCGGAIYNSFVENCSFVNCHAEDSGGALYGGSAVNCSFIGNSAEYDGGAVNNVSAVNCTFADCSSINGGGGAMSGGSAVNCTFVRNFAMSDGGFGGGAIFDGSAVNCTFVGNSAIWGGAMCAMHGGSAVNCTFVGNSADYYGGAMYKGSAVNCSFVNCSSRGYYDSDDSYVNGFGGAMYMGSAVNCSFTGNFARSGGALYDGSAVNCTFIKCEALVYTTIYYSRNGGCGGAIYNSFVENCSFVNCSAERTGGAVYWPGSGGNLTDCSFVNCSAKMIGGAVYCEGNNCKLADCSFVNCSAKDGGAVYWANNYGNVVKSSFVNCHAEDCGGGIYFGGRNCTLFYPIFEGCVAQTGSDWYSVYPLNVTTNKKSTVLSAPDVNTTFGISANLIATLKDVDNNILAGEPIAITLNNVNYSLETDSLGQVSLAIPTDLVAKTYRATITYAGNENYDSSTVAVNVVVNKIDTSISAVYNNAASEIVATLTNNLTGKTISSANVVFKINGATYTVKTNSKGQAKLSVADLPSGKYTATISYRGNSKYNPSNTTIVISDKIDSIISVDDVFVVCGSDVELNATLVNGQTGMGIGDADLSFVVNGEKYTVKTNSDGVAKLTVSGLAVGNYAATVSYSGDSKYGPSNATANIAVSKITTRVLLSYDRSAKELVAVLINTETGKGISSANVVFNLNGVKKSVKTNKQGQARFSIGDVDPDNFNAGVRYGGNSKYFNSTSSIKIVEEKIATVISNVYDRENGEVIATLTNNETGKPISGGTIVFNFNGQKTPVKSNKQGQARFSIKDFAPGTWSAGSSYGGNFKYGGATTAITIVKN